MDVAFGKAASTGLDAGARNLLLGCTGVAPGDRVLIVREAAGNGYYDEAAPDAVAHMALDLGADVETMVVPQLDETKTMPTDLSDAVARSDHTIFCSRIGDQIRFQDLIGTGTKTMCYALDAGFLGAPFSTLPHPLMEAIKARFEALVAGAETWRITCPLGTDVTGRMAADWDRLGTREDFTLRLFPVTTFQPISCATMHGRVALGARLVGTGSQQYNPYELSLDEGVFAIVDAGRIQGFEGPGDSVTRAGAHYDFVASKFGIDRDAVHSWHAGINPQAFYPRPARGEPERWAGVAFGSPRYLHFHTCGDYAPGEICWSLFDATVRFDGEICWQAGRFAFLDRPEIRDLIAEYPGAADALGARLDIGV